MSNEVAPMSMARPPSSRSRSPSPMPAAPPAVAVGPDQFSNHSGGPPVLSSPVDSVHSHRKRSRSRSPSYHRRRSPSPSFHRSKSSAHSSNGGGKGPLPGAVSIFNAVPGVERSGDSMEPPRHRERHRGRDGDGERGPKNDGVCYSWPAGSCKYGDHCFFKHLDESGRDVRKHPPVPPPKKSPAAYPASYRGPPPSASAAAPSSSSAFQSFPKDRSCYEFRNEGRCRFGSRCKYVHEPSGQSTQQYSRPKEFYEPRYGGGPSGGYAPAPHGGQHFSHRRRSRSRDRSRSRSRQRSHRSRSR